MSTHNICFRRGGASNEYPQHMFSSKNKKNIDTFLLKKAPYQELWTCPLMQTEMSVKNIEMNSK